MDGLLTLYIATAIFGVGVTIVDMFGILGSQSDDDSDGGDEAAGDDADGDFDADDGGDFDDGDFDADDGGDDDGDIDDGDVDDGDDDGDIEGDNDEGDTSHNEGSIVAHDNIKHKKNPVLKFLSYLRTLVYFSFGFGPVGWIVFSTGQSGLSSLLYSIPAGIVFAVAGRLLKRLQTHELDSQVKDAELLMERAEVLVTIGSGQMGKIRVDLDNTYIERYAKAKDNTAVYPVGTEVRVVSLTDEYLIVSDEE